MKGQHRKSLDDVIRSFETYFKKGKPTSCWLWRGAKNGWGYGYFNQGKGKTIPAHRFAYKLYVGEIRRGLTIDHLCRTRLCVNPAHLEPVTTIENVMRGNSPHAKNARKTRCKRGHQFNAENTHIVSTTGERACRRCNQLREQKYRNKR